MDADVARHESDRVELHGVGEGHERLRRKGAIERPADADEQRAGTPDDARFDFFFQPGSRRLLGAVLRLQRYRDQEQRREQQRRDANDWRITARCRFLWRSARSWRKVTELSSDGR